MKTLTGFYDPLITHTADWVNAMWEADWETEDRDKQREREELVRTFIWDYDVWDSPAWPDVIRAAAKDTHAVIMSFVFPRRFMISERQINIQENLFFFNVTSWVFSTVSVLSYILLSFLWEATLRNTGLLQKIVPECMMLALCYIFVVSKTHKKTKPKIELL